MNKNLIKFGFIVAGLMNIGGVLLFSRFFNNPVLNQADPVVMSNFGLLMIIVWGLAYMSIANSYQHVRYLVGVFAVEKIIYVLVWLFWMVSNITQLPALYSQDFLAGAFYSIYGFVDITFAIFFSWVFIQLKNSSSAVNG